MQTGKDLGETPPSQAAVTNKLKQVRNKFRKAVQDGKTSGFGRVVTLYYELCQEIWGGCPATDPVTGVESMAVTPNSSTSSLTPTDEGDNTAQSTGEDSDVLATPSATRRNLLDEQLRNHRSNRLKRKVSVDEQLAATMKQDMEVKKQVLQEMTKMSEQNSQQLGQLMGTLERMAQSVERLVASQLPTSAPETSLSSPSTAADANLYNFNYEQL